MNDDSRSGPVMVDERDSVRPPSLRGSTVVEVMVSFTLLSAVLGVATPWVVRHGRLLNNHREYRTAIDELSNQLELVTSLDVDALPDAMGRIAPSKLALARLPGAAMSGEQFLA